MIDELITTAEKVDLVALIYEKSETLTTALIQSFKAHLDLKKQLKEFEPIGLTNFVTLELPNVSLIKAEEAITKALKTNANG